MIIDSHTHILPPDILKRKEHYIRKDLTFKTLFVSKNSTIATIEALISTMDQCGISSSAVLGMGWKDDGLNSYVNDYIIESSLKYPKRIYPFTGINPSSKTLGLQEARRCVELGAYGFGEVHPSFQNFDLGDNELMSEYMNLLECKDLPILIHCSEPVGHQYPGKGVSGFKMIETFVTNFPNNKIVLAHWGAGLPFFELMPEVKAAFKKVYYDSAASPFLYGSNVFSDVVNLVGVEKILFGSDYPVITQNRVLKDLEKNSLTQSQMKSIMETNFKNLIGSSLPIF
ncbi:MAG: amidohydrolase family protein [Dehalococcoidia bacterium]